MGVSMGMQLQLSLVPCPTNATAAAMDTGVNRRRYEGIGFSMILFCPITAECRFLV